MQVFLNLAKETFQQFFQSLSLFGIWAFFGAVAATIVVFWALEQKQKSDEADLAADKPLPTYADIQREMQQRGESGEYPFAPRASNLNARPYLPRTTDKRS